MMRMVTMLSAIALAVLPAMSVQAQSQVPPEVVDGQVQKIDPAAGKITLRHGPIKALDMDSMTMVFRVKDAAMLKAVKVGDKVKFEARRVDGALTVTKIDKAK